MRRKKGESTSVACPAPEARNGGIAWAFARGKERRYRTECASDAYRVTDERDSSLHVSRYMTSLVDSPQERFLHVLCECRIFNACHKCRCINSLL